VVEGQITYLRLGFASRTHDTNADEQFLGVYKLLHPCVIYFIIVVLLVIAVPNSENER
jgi:uncharacterized membrane protein